MEAEVHGDPEAVLYLALGLALQAGEISEEQALAEAARDPGLFAEAFRALGWRPAEEADWELCSEPDGDPVAEDTAPESRYVGPVVYGVVPGGETGEGCLVFIPRDRAAYLAAMHGVLQTATTWGEVRQRLSPEAYRDLLEASGATERPDFEAFYRRERRRARQEGRRLTSRAAWRTYTALDPHERQPFPDDAFCASSIGCYMDGDWPGWPKREMVFWVPRAIQDRYATYLQSLQNGEFLEFSVEDEPALVEAFARHSCPCTRDDELVQKASGY